MNTQAPADLVAAARAMTPEGLVEVARAVDAARRPEDEAHLTAWFGFADPGLVAPMAYHVAALAYSRGCFAFDRLERSFLPPDPAWLHHDLSLDAYRLVRRGETLHAPTMWPFSQDCPVGDYQSGLWSKWLTHGLVHALLGSGSWPGLDEWQLLHMARLSEALASWHWYWLSEIGRLYCPKHTVATGVSVLQCEECAALEAAMADPDERAARLDAADAEGIAANALQMFRYEVQAWRHGLESGHLSEPQSRYLDMGESCEYARFHRGRMVSATWRRWAEHCLTPDRDYADSLEGYERRATELVQAMTTPMDRLPDDVGAARVRRVLQDVGYRLCCAAGLRGDAAGGLETGLRAVADAIAKVDGLDGDAAEALCAEALEAAAADLASTDAAPGVAEVFALGYRPVLSPEREPEAVSSARREAYVGRVRDSGSPLHPVVRRLPKLQGRVVAGVRTPDLAFELGQAAEGAAAAGELGELEHVLVLWLQMASRQWGRDQPQGHEPERWYYRLSCRTLPPREQWDAFRVRPNPYLGSLPAPVDIAWLTKLLADELPEGPLKAKPAETAEHLLVGPGREGPLAIPFRGVVSRLLNALQHTPTVAELVAGDFTEEQLAEALERQVVVCFAHGEAVDLAKPPTLSDEVADMVDPTRRSEPGPWDEEDQAAYYEALCQRNALYADVAKALVDRLRIKTNAQVADLGCGTGVSTREILRRLGPQGRVVGVDPAPRMVEAAKRLVDDERAEFERGGSGHLKDAMPLGPGFSAVVCSSALWLEKHAAEALSDMRRVLRRSGRIGLSVPAEYLGEVEHLTDEAFVAVAGAIQQAREELELAPPEAEEPPGKAVLGSVERLVEAMERAGLKDVEAHVYERPWTVAEYLDWLGQPVVLRGLAPEADAAQRQRLIERLRELVDLEATLRSRWILATAKRG